MSTKRQQVMTFGRINNLRIKADKDHTVTVFCPKTNYVDLFDGWEDAYAFLQKCVHENNRPWDRQYTNYNHA